MKRDMDLAREILLIIEENNDGPLGWIEIAIDGRNEQEISYHIAILDEAGLIEGKDLSTFSGFQWKARRLTWQGHEFLDSARNDTIWQKAKEKVSEAAGGLTLDLLKEALFALAKKSLIQSFAA